MNLADVPRRVTGHVSAHERVDTWWTYCAACDEHGDHPHRVVMGPFGSDEFARYIIGCHDVMWPGHGDRADTFVMMARTSPLTLF